MSAKVAVSVVAVGHVFAASAFFANMQVETPEKGDDEPVEAIDRNRVCENSDDRGKAGAMGCFLDRGDEFFACDIHKGGSSTARVQVTEWKKKLPRKRVRDAVGQRDLQVGGPKVEEDNAADGVKVLGDCDEGAEININAGNWGRIDICIENESTWGASCDQRWVRE